MTIQEFCEAIKNEDPSVTYRFTGKGELCLDTDGAVFPDYTDVACIVSHNGKDALVWTPSDHCVEEGILGPKSLDFVGWRRLTDDESGEKAIVGDNTLFVNLDEDDLMEDFDWRMDLEQLEFAISDQELEDSLASAAKGKWTKDQLLELVEGHPYCWCRTLYSKDEDDEGYVDVYVFSSKEEAPVNVYSARHEDASTVNDSWSRIPKEECVEAAMEHINEVYDDVGFPTLVYVIY